MQPTLVVAANLFLFNQAAIDNILLWHDCVALDEWGQLEFHGKDCETWLQRQLAQDVKSLPASGRAVVRLDRAAHITFYGVLRPIAAGYQLIFPLQMEAAIRADVEKFVIMEDLQLSAEVVTDLAFSGDKNFGEPLNFFGVEGSYKVFKDAAKNDQFFSACGIPRIGIDINEKILVNETRLDELAVNYDKGCFLGQETAAKIRSRRGANHAPVVLISDSELVLGDLTDQEAKAGKVLEVMTLEQGGHIANALLKREWRIMGAVFSFGQVHKYPYIQYLDNLSRAKHLYLSGVKDFEQHQEERALEKLKRALEFDPALADAYEAIGVIYSRHGKHEETIRWMDHLLEVNPKSVMAHTNKSLAYMKLGQIEKAEEEKAEATVKSFAMFGEEAKSKKAIDEAKQREQAELDRRAKMFEQVLQIDGEDLVALFGLADIAYKRQAYSQALELVEKALRSSPKHSQSILLSGKCHEALKQFEQAIEIYQAGIRVASSQGELMPANEMQSRLNQLIRMR